MDSANPEAENQPDSTLSSSSSSEVEMNSDAHKLITRAQTLLRQATLTRFGIGSGETKATIIETVKDLERENTRFQIQSQIKPNEDTEMVELWEKKDKELNDSDFDTDLEEETEKNPDSSALSKCDLYESTCKKLGIRPVPSIRDSLSDGGDVIVPNRMMDALDMLSLSNALVNNQKVAKLILDGNNIGDPGAQCLAWLLTDHGCYLHTISLCDNGIGTDGFEAIGEILEENKILRFLNLSGNLAEDDNIERLAAALKENRELQYLSLSHNNIGDKGACFLASAIAANDGLQTLDLSWNKIRPAGGVAVCHALKDNITLKSFHLAMNGLGTPGAMFIGDVLQTNCTLTYLNVTFNRIFDEGAKYIAKGLEKNEALHNLIIHNNPITSVSAVALLHGIHKNVNSAMWKLDMSTVPVIQEAVNLFDEINNRSEFEFRYKGLINCEASMIGDSNTLNARNPLALVKEYIENEGLRLVDFFKQMDKDRSGTISRDEFVVGLTSVNVFLSQHQMDTLMESLDENGDGEIDYKELIEGDREYRRKKRERRKIERQMMSTGRVKDYFGYQSTA